MINVLVVDDSAVVRNAFMETLENVADICVVDTASNPIFAQRKLEKHHVDVMILDIEMPEMDGLTYLKQIMRERPMPVIICSSIASKGSRYAMEALSLGAVEVIEKPTADLQNFFDESREMLLDKIRSTAKSRPKTKEQVEKSFEQHRLKEEPKLDTDVMLPSIDSKVPKTDPIVAIGGSTGAVQVIEYLLSNLRKCPGIVVVQHMPEGFTRSFAERLDKICAISVKEAEDGDEVRPNTALIAPGNRHMVLQRQGNRYRVRIKDGPRISRHRPSVNVLFRSCANEAGRNALGLILTGMGDDGASGMHEMKRTGSLTLAQNEQSCIVYGMPKEAIDLGAAEESTPKDMIIKIRGLVS